MSLQHAAQHLAAHGRGPDTTLVHMTQGEVKSLNDLAIAHGGHLTVNPHTGLPEAGFLSAILPSVIGFGLNMAFPGLGQIGAGLIGGGLSMALNPGHGLMGGLMAGLGAYGGAGLGDALAKSGMEQVTEQELAKNSALQQAQASATPQAMGLGDVQKFGIPSPIPPDQYSQMMQEAAAPATDMTQATMGRVATDSGFGAPGLSTSTAGNRMGTALEGVKGLGNEAGRSSFMNNIGGGMGLAKTGLMALNPVIAESMQPKPPPEIKTDTDPGQQYDYSANPTSPTPKHNQYGMEQKYFDPRYAIRTAAGGGVLKDIFDKIASAGGGNQSSVPDGYSYDPAAQKFSEIAPAPSEDSSGQGFLGDFFKSLRHVESPQQYQYNTDTQQYTKMATGGISNAYNLGGYSDGGRLLRGPGDGVSDSIPATIGHKQPARLADGEFVVPARIVSELGNGSTEAGARRLYAMMDRIQSARSKTIGKGKIAKNSKAEQYLPA